MDKLVKYYLEDNLDLIKKYKKAEDRYLKKLGDKYETVQIDLDFEEEEMKKIFHALANAEICMDEYLLSILKIAIVEKEMEKL